MAKIQLGEECRKGGEGQRRGREGQREMILPKGSTKGAGVKKNAPLVCGGGMTPDLRHKNIELHHNNLKEEFKKQISWPIRDVTQVWTVFG